MLRDEIYHAAARIKDDIGQVSILVNNAGIVSGDSLLNTPDNKIIKTFEVNTLAHFWTIKVVYYSIFINPIKPSFSANF